MIVLLNHAVILYGCCCDFALQKQWFGCAEGKGKHISPKLPLLSIYSVSSSPLNILSIFLFPFMTFPICILIHSTNTPKRKQNYIMQLSYQNLPKCKATRPDAASLSHNLFHSSTSETELGSYGISLGINGLQGFSMLVYINHGQLITFEGDLM